MRRSLALCLLAFGFALLSCFAGSLRAADDWRPEYEAICSQTNLALTHTAEELKGLIARCDRLQARIEAENESTRKVYLRRVKMCRDLYLYVLEHKEGK